MKSATSPHVGTNTLATRVAWLSLGGSVLGILWIARALQPDPRGFGTHVQLGLPPCAFLSWTHLPCPACGLTTSFAFMARLDVVAAWHANAFGVPLFLLGLVAVPLCAWAALRDLPPHATYLRLRGPAVLSALAIVWLASWIARVVAVAR